MKTFKFALIGCGRISERHGQLLSSHSISGATLVAVCDLDEQRAVKAGNSFGVPYFTDGHSMLEQIEGIDVLVVLTDSGSHADVVCEFAKYGKHIIVEKPMALTLTDADRMIDSCDENGIRLFVVKQNRFNVPVQKLRSVVESKRIGDITLGTVRVRWTRTQEYYDQDPWRGTWLKDGGVLANQASHHVDLLEWMLGAPQSVFAYSKTALANIEAEDTAIAVVKFKSGALGIIEATTATRPQDLEGSISILGSRGTVVIEGFAVNKMMTWKFIDQDSNEESSVLDNYSVNPPDVYGFGHKEYYDHVIDCLLNSKSHLVDGLEGRKSLEFITAIYESIESKREVQIGFSSQHAKLGK